MKTTSSEYVVYINCSECQNKKPICVHQYTGKSMNNLLSYCGLVDPKISASDKDLPVPCPCFPLFNNYFSKKLSFYIHIPNFYLGLGFEFELGLQRIRYLAFVCP